MGIRFDFGRMTGTSRKSIDTATEDPEEAKVGSLARTQFIGRCRAITVDSDIV
jgi:hypothetical protein